MLVPSGSLSLGIKVLGELPKEIEVRSRPQSILRKGRGNALQSRKHSRHASPKPAQTRSGPRGTRSGQAYGMGSFSLLGLRLKAQERTIEKGKM